ncbi:MAG: hypothetical protein HWE30_02265 [Methylocystaceae bacterium]|nr:hypothetical protein [Methylocystaceae bacterium]
MDDDKPCPKPYPPTLPGHIWVGFEPNWRMMTPKEAAREWYERMMAKRERNKTETNKLTDSAEPCEKAISETKNE